jgi:hypothetical protein
MKSDYAKSAISDLSATADRGQLTLSYRYPAESLYYSGGINVDRSGDVIRLMIVRCKVNEACAPDLPSQRPKPSNFMAEVSFPYAGERVLLVHSDGEEEIAL